jgi:hypothetical protein
VTSLETSVHYVETSLEEAESGWLKVFLVVEAVMGLTAALFLEMFPLICLLFLPVVLAVDGRWGWAAASLIPLVLYGWLARWLINSANYAMQRCYPEIAGVAKAVQGTQTPHYPFAVEMALRLPRLPLLFRPWASLWWGAHFMAGVVILEVAHRHLAGGGAPDALTVLTVLGIHFAFSVAANLYLMLSVAALWSPPDLLCWIWRHRITIDAVFTLAATSWHFLQ